MRNALHILLASGLIVAAGCTGTTTPIPFAPDSTATLIAAPVETTMFPIAAPDTATPPPATVTPGTPEPPSAPEEIDPYIEIGAWQTELRVGEVITVTGAPIQLGLPYYYLYLRDEGIQDVPPIAQVTYENQLTLGDGVSQVLELVSLQADMSQVVIVLRAKAPGITTLNIQATGEVRLQDGAYSMSGIAAGDILISVR